ncbi:MAG: hypothetical protein ABI844_18755 [Saprospiraceae bacterium]
MKNNTVSQWWYLTCHFLDKGVLIELIKERIIPVPGKSVKQHFAQRSESVFPFIKDCISN